MVPVLSRKNAFIEDNYKVDLRSVTCKNYLCSLTSTALVARVFATILMAGLAGYILVRSIMQTIIKTLKKHLQQA